MFIHGFKTTSYGSEWKMFYCEMGDEEGTQHPSFISYHEKLSFPASADSEDAPLNTHDNSTPAPLRQIECVTPSMHASEVPIPRTLAPKNIQFPIVQSLHCLWPQLHLSYISLLRRPHREQRQIMNRVIRRQ